MEQRMRHSTGRDRDGPANHVGSRVHLNAGIPSKPGDDRHALRAYRVAVAIANQPPGAAFLQQFSASPGGVGTQRGQLIASG
jgi:hypothetical protein